MKNIKNLNFTELTKEEMLKMEGGNGGRRIKRKILEYGAEVFSCFLGYHFPRTRKRY